MSHSLTEGAQQQERGEANEKSTCDTSSEKREEERERELSFSYGKCFSLQKVPF